MQNSIQSQGKKRGRPAKNSQNVQYVPSIIDFNIEKLDNVKVDPRMMETMKSGSSLDNLISYEGGIPCASNIMCCGDPGIGKTTILLDVLAGVKVKSKRKCLFISGEMGRKQMFKYTQRFKHFGVIDTIFTSDYVNYNSKDVIEQILDKGWDCILIDSVAEVLDAVRNDNNWDRKMAESWFVDVCIKQNKGENKENKFSSFLLIQQVTKGGQFVGSNKLKHLTDAMMEIRKGKSNSSDYIVFSKNRNGNADVKFGFQLTNNSIHYGTLVSEEEFIDE